MGRQGRAQSSSGPGNLRTFININDLHPTQLGWSMECAVREATCRNPKLTDPMCPDFLGAFDDIVYFLSASIDVAHVAVTAGRTPNTQSIGAGLFNSRWLCTRMFKVTTGGEVWLGGNEAGWTCTRGEVNQNRFTHCVECRHDFAQTEERGRVGPGPRAYERSGVSYRNFDVNRCMKLTGGQVLSAGQLDYIFDFIYWVTEALRRPNAKVLVHCALAAWVNEIAPLLQYGPASTDLNNGSNASSSDTRKTSKHLSKKLRTTNRVLLLHLCYCFLFAMSMLLKKASAA